ncbi:PA domain [Dillenia turbinata]|uniref:PA domain n=1 Tax=Dillenia turbinata TaxID=194707 RepID=A0AAN8V402_9MAGN
MKNWKNNLSILQSKTLIELSIILCCTLRITSGTVHLKAKSLSISFIDAPARFAVGANNSGICGSLHLADPLDACSSLLNRFESDGKVRFALIVRGKCAFEEKIRNAQDGGFHAAIVYDDVDKKKLVSMIGKSDGIHIHAVFVSKIAGETLKKHAWGKEGECCIKPSHEETAWNVLLISLISLVLIVAVLVTFLVARNHRMYWQSTNRCHPVIDVKLVESLPCCTFNPVYSSSHHGRETCAICLEDYRDGECLRVLPCQHEFHAGCVDSWLTKWSTFCPVCKHDISMDRDVMEHRPLLVS